MARLGHTISVRLSEDLWDRLVGLSTEWGVKPSTMVRTLLVSGLEKTATPMQVAAELDRLAQAVEELKR